MYTKVEKGTPRHDQSSMCSTCSRAVRITGDSLDQEIIFCNAIGDFGRQITFRVSTCSSYTDERLPSLYDMRQAAWILQTDEKKRTIGFRPSKDLTQTEQQDIDEELRRAARE